MAENIGGPFGTKRVYNTPSGGGMQIGNPVIKGTPYSKLFIDANGDLAENSRFYFNPDAINELTEFRSFPQAYFQPLSSKFVGLNDVSVDASGITINPSQLVIAISGVAPDEFTYTENGVNYPTPLPCGTPHTTPNGAVINFASSTGHTLGDVFFFVCMRNRTEFLDALMPIRPATPMSFADHFGWQRSISKTGQSVSQRVEFDITTGDVRSYETVQRNATSEKSERTNNGTVIREQVSDLMNPATHSKIEVYKDRTRQYSRDDSLSSETDVTVTPSYHQIVSVDGSSYTATVTTTYQDHTEEITDGSTIEKTSLSDKEYLIQAGQVVLVENLVGNVTLDKRNYVVLKGDVSTVNLPAWIDATLGKVYIIKNFGAAGNVTVSPVATETIDGGSSVTLASNEAVTIIRTNVSGEWAVIGRA